MKVFYETGERTAKDRAYGEVYEYVGGFWAEAIFVEDGIERVLAKSPEYPTRELAESWLAERGYVVDPMMQFDVLVASVFSPVARVFKAVAYIAKASWATAARANA